MGYVILTSVISLVFLLVGFILGRETFVGDEYEEEPVVFSAYHHTTEGLEPVLVSELDEYEIEQQRKGVKGE